MLDFQVIASSSAGNAYRLYDGESSLLIEAGVKIKEIKKAFDFKLSSEAVGCLISHEHGDHAGAVEDVLKAGVNCYMTQGTADALGLKHHRIKVIEAKKEFRIGSWRVLPFPVQHDANDPVGFLIMNGEGEKMLFATDTFYIRYKFKGLHVIAVECNYSEDILRQNILDGLVPVAMKNRLAKSHFSLENALEFIRATDLSEVREIWLLHMSDKNSDAELFREEVMKVSGKPVYIAG